MYDQAFFRSVNDYRGYLDADLSEVYNWRTRLREHLFKLHGFRSMLTQMPLRSAFDMHEGLFTRSHVPQSSWQQLLYSGPNCFILRPQEHRVEFNQSNPPGRVLCYWLSVAFYGKSVVDHWVASLPFKTKDTPWTGTRGVDMVASIPDFWEVDATWHDWYLRIESKVDLVG